MRLRNVILLLFFIVLRFDSMAQDQQYDTVQVVEPDDTYAGDNEEDDEENATAHTYKRMYMDEEKLNTLRQKKEFRYKDLDSMAMQDTASLKPPNTAVEEARRFKGFNANILLWLIAGVAVIVLILQLTGVNLRQVFAPARLPSIRVGDDNLPENIHDIPYENAITQAIGSKNFSLATRLMYLQSLKLLSDKNMITWHENKTNWQYLYELKGEGLQRNFRLITNIFEYVQYGHMPINEDKFMVVQDAFKKFKMHVI